MTALTYRNTGAWGAGVGRLLTSLEVDTNFYNIDQGKLDKANTGPVTGRQRPNTIFNPSAAFGNLAWTGGFLTAYAAGAGGDSYWSNAAALTGSTIGPDLGEFVACLSSTAYTLQAEMSSGPMTAGNVKTDVQFFDSTQTLIGTGSIVAVLASGQAQQRIVASGVSPSNAAYYKVRKYADTSPTGPINCATWRRIKVEQATSDSLWSDEASESRALQKANNLSDVASVATARSNLGVGLVKLASGDLSGTAGTTIQLPTGYNTHRLVMEGVRVTSPSTGRELRAQFSADGGATFITGTVYGFGYNAVVLGTSTAVVSYQGGISNMTFSGGLVNQSGYFLNVTGTFNGMSRTDKYKSFIGQADAILSDGQYRVTSLGCLCNNNGAVNAFKLYLDNGENFVAGKWTLYGEA